jgi:hypothetical protein
VLFVADGLVEPAAKHLLHALHEELVEEALKLILVLELLDEILRKDGLLIVHVKRYLRVKKCGVKDPGVYPVGFVPFGFASLLLILLCPSGSPASPNSQRKPFTQKNLYSLYLFLRENFFRDVLRSITLSLFSSTTQCEH